MVVVVTGVAVSDTSSSLPVCRCHVSLSSPLHAERASPVRIATGNTRATARDACVAEASGSRRCTRAGGLAAGVVVPFASSSSFRCSLPAPRALRAPSSAVRQRAYTWRHARHAPRVTRGARRAWSPRGARSRAESAVRGDRAACWLFLLSVFFLRSSLRAAVQRAPLLPRAGAAGEARGTPRARRAAHVPRVGPVVFALRPLVLAPRAFFFSPFPRRSAAPLHARAASSRSHCRRSHGSTRCAPVARGRFIAQL